MSARKVLKIASSEEEKRKSRMSLRAIPLINIPWGTPAPVDLYQNYGQELSVLVRQGQSLSPEAYDEVITHSEKLYYNKEAQINWKELVVNNLSNILEVSFSLETKAKIAYEAITNFSHQIFEDFTKEGYEKTKETIDVFNGLLDEPGAFDCFMKLTVHDYYTYTHSVHVYIYASILTRTLLKNKNQNFLNDLGVGYLLHDIGKKDIQIETLNKPGPLDDDEWELVKNHPQVGYEMLTEMSGGLSEEVAQIVLQHHEKCNGSGYPYGLKGKEIGYYGKICAIADVFDALTTRRPYKKAMSKFESMALMKESHGHFDEDILFRFIQI